MGVDQYIPARPELWPSREAILDYRNHVRAALLDLAERLDPGDVRHALVLGTVLEHELMQRIFTCAEHPAGVGELEPRAFPLHSLRKDVACGARNRRHDGATSPRNTIEQRRFPHIWATDQHD